MSEPIEKIEKVKKRPVDPIDYLEDLPPIPPFSKGSPHIDSGLSSIEKSKAVKPELIPPMNNPVLTAPNEQCVAYAVASLDATGNVVTNTIHSFVLKGEEIKDSVLKGWLNNLREIEEYVRQQLASPVYQQMLEVLRKGDPRSGAVSGVLGAANGSANSKGSTSQVDQIELLSTLDRLQSLERIPPSAEVSGASAPNDSTRVLVLPLTAALLAGGGFAIGSEVVHAASPLEGVMEMIGSIQPLFPTVSVQDLVPLINLMVVGPIYFNSWNEAVGQLKEKRGQNHRPAIHDFAKDVIKIVTDPSFVNSVLVQKMKGTEHLSPADQDRLARMLKVVLIGVALSLLYSAEVGKVQKGKFGGIEPEELRDLLLGKLTGSPDPSKKLSEQEFLTSSLISRVWEQLEPLSIEDRTTAVEMLLSYITKQRDFDPMLDPAKVFDDAIDASRFNPKGKIGMVKA